MTRSSFTALSCLWSVVSLTAALSAACGETSTVTPDQPPREQQGPVVEPACPAVSKPAVIHEGDVEGTETWAADAPHLVREDLYIRGGAKVIVEPCATVTIATARTIFVDSPMGEAGTSLVAEGTAQRPIRFVGENGTRYNRIYVTAPATARFAYTTFQNGGAEDIDARGQETLGIAGDNEWPVKEVVFVDHVTIEGSGGAGIRVDRGATFAPGSRDLVVKGAGALGDAHPYPVEVSEAAVTSLPTGAFTGNLRDEILIEPEAFAQRNGFQTDATIHERGVPYHVGRFEGHDELGVGYGDTKAVLTIEAGVTLRFEKGNGISIRSDERGTSAIRALGTRDKPVTFTSAATNPQPGDWRGLTFYGPISAENLIEHAILDYTGADCGCQLVSCSNNTVSEGAIIFGEPPPKNFVFYSEFKHGSANGIVQGFDGTPFDYTFSNVFEDLSGCNITRPRSADTTCMGGISECKL